MGQHKIVKLRTCLDCGAQETTDADGLARHACEPDPAWMRRRRRGRCTRCGKPCLPYAQCARHRLEGRLRYALNRGARYGLFIKSYEKNRVLYALGDERAQVGTRGWYHTSPGSRPPRGFFTYVQALLRQRGPLREDEIVNGFTEYRRQRAARGHLEARAR